MTSKVTRRARFADRRTRQKIRKVGQLIKLSAEVKSSRLREAPPMKQRTYGPRQSTEETSVDSKL